MFKAQILVGQETNVAAELARIESLARKHRLDDATMHSMLRDVENVLADLKRQDSETAAYGIKIAVRKTVSTERYCIVLELRSRKEPSRKRGPLSRLFGR